MRHYRFQLAGLLFVLLGAQIPIAGSATSGFEVDTEERFLSRWFYNIVYQSSEGTEAAWTGDVDTCLEGGTSQTFKAAVIRRVNYYRAMAGIPAGVTLNVTFSAKAQEAALMMAAENALSHFPDPGWACYSSDGDEAAGSSNLSLGHSGWDAISGQVRDNGSNNAATGHRRWILYPQTREMGTGDIPGESNSLWVFDDHYSDARPSVRDGFVAWPPPGYAPYWIVYPRWSFSYPQADFSAASVTMSQDGIAVDLELEPVIEGAGENTLVWIPQGATLDDDLSNWPRPQEDMTYDVTIDGVEIGNVLQDPFNYQVTVIDPLTTGPGEIVPWIDGPESLAVNDTGQFTFTPVPHAISYQWRYGELESMPGVEGAENGLVDIIDDTSASYPLITTDLSENGAASFHLAHADSITQSFQFEKAWIPGDAAELVFNSRLGWATADQVATVQISIDNGGNWDDLWQQAGTGNGGETSFAQRHVSLAEYAGRTVHVRFAYQFDEGTFYPQTSAGVGFYVDDIEITDAAQTSSWTTAPTGPGTQFDFASPVAGEYGLQVRALLWEGFPGIDWGPMHSVRVSSGGNGQKTVPDVVGLAQADATAQITAAGLTLGTVTDQYSETVAAGDVISQNPAAGTSVAPGSSVELSVSLGQREIPSAWILGIPAFAAPGTSLIADGSESSDADGGGVAYDWSLNGPCAADGSVTSAMFSFAINADAPVTYPSTPCRVTLRVTDDYGLTDDTSFDIVLLPAAEEITMQKAYIAYYGRPAGPAGLHYWGVRLYEGSGMLNELIIAYGTSTEYTGRYSEQNDEALINTLFQNMFGRDADTVGRQWYIDERLIPYRQFWTDSHGGDPTGATEYALSRIALDILYGAQNEDREIIDHKLEVARHFTEQVVRWGVVYDEPDIPTAVALLQQVTDDPASVNTAKSEVDAAIPTL